MGEGRSGQEELEYERVRMAEYMDANKKTR